MPTEDELNQISRTIIGCGIEVHRRVGPGCLESAYSPCLALEFCKAGLDFRREVALTLRYDELVIPRAYFADFIVEDLVVVEIKAVAATTARDRRQLQTYLELDGAPLGLVLNFGAKLLSDDVIRAVNNFPAGTRPSQQQANRVRRDAAGGEDAEGQAQLGRESTVIPPGS